MAVASAILLAAACAGQAAAHRPASSGSAATQTAADRALDGAAPGAAGQPAAAKAGGPADARAVARTKHSARPHHRARRHRHVHHKSAASGRHRITRPKPAPTKPPVTSTDASAADQLLAKINKDRADNGLAAYTMKDGLVRSAHQHNLVMAGGCGLSHQCPGEAPLGDRETAQGVHWTAAGENIGCGGAGASAAEIARMALSLDQAMMDEKPPGDGHRQNLLSSTYRYVGISVDRDAKGTVWLTQDFSN